MHFNLTSYYFGWGEFYLNPLWQAIPGNGASLVIVLRTLKRITWVLDVAGR